MLVTIFYSLMFMAFFAYFVYVILRFFSSPFALVQFPLYIFGFLWGVFSGSFFGLKSPENSYSLWGLFTHDGPGNYFVQNSTSGMPTFDFIVEFFSILILCHFHGVMISPIAILATLEFIFTILLARAVLR